MFAIVGTKKDSTDVEESLVKGKKYVAKFEKGYATKEKEWAETCKFRQVMMMLLNCSRRRCHELKLVELCETM